MLSLGKIAAGPNAARYYVDQVARDRGDYYAGEGEAPGVWMGSGARSLGLAGEVGDDRFAALLNGAGLRRAPSKGAVAGFDLTFRAPKSVSVLWAVAPPDVATVDRTFVLGSDELYREWGYTALSRHRDEARFYIARGDLGLDRDQAPAPDPVVAGIARILGRSRAKELACEALPEFDDQVLARESAQLRARLGDGPPPREQVEVLAERARAEHERLEATRSRIERLQRARDAAPRWRRGELGELGRLLELNRSRASEAELVCAQARGDHGTALDARRAWIAEHGPDAERLVVIDNEQRRRAVDERDARSRTAGLDRAPDPWSHVLGSVQPDRNQGIER